MAIQYEEFDIVEVAKMCGVQFHAYDHNEIEYKALCPFCGDTSYHLGLNRKMDRFHCFRCKTRGNICENVWSDKQTSLRNYP